MGIAIRPENRIGTSFNLGAGTEKKQKKNKGQFRKTDPLHIFKKCNIYVFRAGACFLGSPTRYAVINCWPRGVIHRTAL